MFCNYRIWTATQITSHYTDGSPAKYKDLSDFSNQKSWEYVLRLVRKKAMQDSSLKDKDDVEGFIDTPYCNKGVGGRFKWGIRNTEVYDSSVAAVVEKHYHVFNAVLISPDSWIDNQLQKAYYARRNGSKKDTDDQETTPE